MGSEMVHSALDHPRTEVSHLPLVFHPLSEERPMTERRQWPRCPERSTGTVLLQLLYFAVLATAALPRNKWVVGAALSFLSLVYLLFAVSQAVSRAG